MTDHFVLGGVAVLCVLAGWRLGSGRFPATDLEWVVATVVTWPILLGYYLVTR